MAAFTLNRADLEFILKQIKVSEAHANGTPLTEIYVDPEGNVVPAGTPGAVLAIPDPHVPVGLRTVDGTYNNIVAGRENFGAADQAMPRLLDPHYVNDLDGDQFDADGPGPAPATTNGNYANPGNVADADPRTISNLIVDMSLNNPAAVIAALTFAGSEDPHADLQRLLDARVTQAEADAAVVTAQTALDTANANLDAAVAGYVPGDTASIDAIQDAAEAVTAAEQTLEAAETVAADPAAALETLAGELGLVINSEGSLVIPNVAPDEGLSAPFNAWMTFFGQFFDHGLDLITKGGNGTVYIPLEPDDPLYVPGGHSNFMVLTRAAPDENGEHTNTTTSWVDQNQTYTSHASHQVFLREYKFSEDTDSDGVADARAVATGRLLDGHHTEGSVVNKNGLPTWADVKDQAQTMLGLTLSDVHVLEVPLLATDEYGMFERGPNGYAQVLVEVEHSGGTAVLKVEGKAGGLDLLNITAADLPAGHGLADVTTIAPLGTRHAFLDDIAHNAVPKLGLVDHDRNPATAPIEILPDDDDVAGNPLIPNQFGINERYDDELLERHFITGDGRGNENIGLTAVHHVFHSEHNRQIDSQKLIILQSGDLDFINEWLVGSDITALPDGFADMTAVQQLAFGETLNWDGERLFQAGRFATEMQYQHLVFEEFARKVQPAIDPFVFNSITDIDPSIFSEFANVVYRFGHSMLTDSMPRVLLNEDGTVASTDDMGLIDSFLNPIAFNNDGALTAEEAAGAIVRGMTIERGNEIDEFVTGALRNNLLGLPLDLATINIARGRDTGMPTLNQAREQLYAATGSTFLTPYDSWTDFAANLKNPISVVNFIAAYGLHASITDQVTDPAAVTPTNPTGLRDKTLEEKRDAAWALVFGETVGTATVVPADRLDFLNSTGDYNAGNNGLNTIDLWIGGLAEKKMPFGGFLGSTFNAVFEAQLEALQDGDRFYYLTRTQGQNFLNMLEQNSFAKMIMANTDISQPGADGIRGTADDVISRHIGVDSFANYDFVLEVNAANQADYDPENNDLDGPGPVDPLGNDPALEAMGLGKVQRDNPGTLGPDANYIRFTGGEHVVVGGTNNADTIITDFGDDGIWGDAGNDRIESGAGVDLVNGGSGDDIITDSGDSGDFIKGDEGNDVIANSNGLDILMGGSGKDAIFVGVDDTEVFGGEGDDFIAGGAGVDLLMGNEGDDWMEAAGGFDTTAGDNSELFFNSAIKGHDVMFAGDDEHDFDAESGDDIMVQGESVMRNEGMFGFDWAIFKDAQIDGYADMRIPIFTTEQEDVLRNRFDKVEALSGWNGNDTLLGDDRVFGEIAPGDTVATTEGIFFNDGLDQAGIDRITGLSAIVRVNPETGFFEAGNILLGGAGNDNLRGNGGDDILDGDRWLNVRISIRANADGTGAELATVDTMRHTFAADDTSVPAAWRGHALFELLVNRTIVPTQMQIVREIVDTGATATDEDIAFFNDVRANYTVERNTDGSFTVTHVTVSVVIDPLTERNLVSDGVDTLHNVEIARFLDEDVLLVNRAPTGFPTITGTENVLTANINGIADQNGLPPAADFDYQWQVSNNGLDGWTNIGTNSPTFAVANNDNRFYRVAVSYTDDSGYAETVTSQMTAVVGDNNGGGVNDTLNGTADPNLINGRDGNDTLNGGQGDDVINGGDDNDTLNGGAGNDTLNGGANTDTVTYVAATGAVTVNLATGLATGADGNDTLTSIENVTASNFDDVLTGNAGDNLLAGRTGNDTYRVDLNGGDDTINELGGQDRITILTAGAALASLSVSDDGAGTNDGNLDIAFNGQTLTAIDHFDNTNEGVELINFDGGSYAGYQLGSADYTVSTADPANSGTPTARTVTVASGNNLLAGETGADRLTGGTGNDLLFGAAGNDILNGGAGNDLLVGGDGNDTVSGGDGNDVIVYDIDEGDGGGDTITGGANTDTLAIVDEGGNDAETLSVNFDGTRITQIEGGGSVAADVESVTASLGAGSDTLAYNTASAVSVDLAAGTATGFTSIAGVDNVTGGTGSDTFRGNADDNVFTGNGGTDRVVFSGTASAHVFTLDGTSLEVTGTGGTDTLSSVEQLEFDDGVYALVQGTGGVNTLTGSVNADLLLGFGGNDTINAGAGDDMIVYNAGTDGRDIVNGGTEGTEGDTFVINGTNAAETYRVYTRAAWDAVAGNDGASLAAATEIVITRNGTNFASVIAELADIEEIRINTGPGNDTVLPIGDFSPTSLSFNTITIDGSEGNDTVDISSLTSAHRIVFKSNGGNDTIVGTMRPQDVIELADGQSLANYTTTVNPNGTTTLSNGTHSITFASNGNPVIVDDDDDVIDGAFELTARDIAGLKNLVQGRPAFEDDDDTEGHEGIRDLEGTGNNVANPDFGSADQPFIRLTEARYGDLNDEGNRDINPIFDGLDPRDISNILGEQEDGLPKQANDANIFFMAFGQYFDHGLDFLPKNAAYGKLEIGGPDEGAPFGSTPADLTRGEVSGFDEDGNPEHMNKTSPFVDQNQAYGSNELVGQFLRESDGNQGVGMRLLQGGVDPSNPDFNLLPTLRELIQHHWEANTIFHDASLPGGQISFRDYYSNYPIPSGATGNLLDEVTGAFDPDVLNAAVSNFMGSGFPLLLDTNPFISLLDHFVAGDGRANENFALTAMHTVWARNHNFHVEKLLEAGFDGTDEEVFQAAKMLNEAEYQRVVFDEFADALIGGIRGLGTHGHEGYNEEVDARISHEFASAVYRVGHSLIGQTMTILDENGQPKQVALFDAFLNPSNDPGVFTAPLPPGYVPQPGYAQLGVSSILGGIAQQPAEEVDFNIVDAVRNDLVRINADLFSFNVARGRDVGLGTLNQVRADLKASLDPYIREAIGFAGNMDPYTSWADFQARNGLSNTVIAQFMEAYPDLVLDTQEKIDAFVEVNPDIQLQDGPNGSKIVKGIDRVDLWVGGLAEQHINGGMVGQTFWVVLHEQFDRLQEGDRFYYLDRFDNFDFYEEFVDGQEFADIIARNTGLTNLPEHIFEADLEDEDDDDDTGQDPDDDDDEDEDDDDDTGTGGDDDEDEDDDDPTGSDDDEDEEDDDDEDDTSGSDDDDDEDEDDEDDEDDTSGDDDDDDDTTGEDDDDTTVPPPPVQPGVGTALADVLVGTAAADNLIGLASDDVIMGHGGDDAIVAGEGNDFVNGGEGRDVISANAGDDHVFGGGAADMIYGDAGDDRLFGDAGDDLINAGAGSDTVVGGAGNDLFVAEVGDGNDSYFGDEPNGGTGIDTLDMSAITAAITVDLGTGVGGHGSTTSAQSGTDALWGVENVIGGSGADSITASEAVNVMDGGAGNDTFRFLSAAAANGDTIVNFQVGDQVDLTGIDANSGVTGNQAFSLVAGPTFTAAAQLMVSYETRADGDYTVIQGNTGGDNTADFKLSLKGTHEFVPDDLKL
ncbi:peroxidase family protein [Flaviflagellibacter deserti]|uniref:Peroxidase family protein n=1 Tax=Flaviflagellibacter deserti TaxID=2267266 RepID=A0ABV9Z2H5_9HYPH